MQIFSKTGLIRIVLITAVLFSIFFLIPAISPNLDLRALLQSKSRHFLLIVVPIVFFHFLLEPMRWYLYTRNTEPGKSADNPSFSAVFSVLSTTALFSYSLPFKLGLPTRIYLINEYLGLTAKRIIFFLTVDGVMNLAVWGLFGAVSFIYLLPIAEVLSNYAFAIAAALGVVLALFLGRKFIGKIISPLVDREFEISARTIALSGSLVTFDVVGFGLRHIAIFMFLGLPVNYLDAFLIGILSIFAGIASTLPMGLGAYDATLILLLTTRGVSLELASLAPVLNRTLNLLSSILFGGLGSVFLMRRPT